MKKINKYITTALFLGASVASAFAQADSNHSYRMKGVSKKPVVTIGGFSDFKGAKAKQESHFENNFLPNISKTSADPYGDGGVANKNNGDIAFGNDTEVHVKVNGISDLGLKYGAVIELEANSTNDSWNSDVNADKAYIFTESWAGKLEFGNNIGAAQKMKVGAETIARAAGGINGEYLNYINLPMIAHADYYTQNDATSLAETGFKVPRFILIPQHPTGHGGYAKGYDNYMFECDYNGNNAIDTGDETTCYNARHGKNFKLDFEEIEDATKVSYYSPRVWGLQFGASYTPDTANHGTSGETKGIDNMSIKEVYDWGLGYTNAFGNVGLSVTVTGQEGESQHYRYTGGVATKTREDLSSMEYGINLTYFGLTLAGSYGDWGNSLQEKRNVNNIYSFNYNTSGEMDPAALTDSYKSFDDATYNTLGLSYEFGPYAFSGTYFKSEFQDNEFSAFSLGVDYQISKGLMSYAEITSFEFDSNQPRGTELTTAQENEGVIKDNEGYVGLVGILLNF